MPLIIKQLSTNDGLEVYEMLQTICADENEFKNTAYGLSYDEFKRWLIEQDAWSRGMRLPDGYVSQVIYWLLVDGVPAGMGKIRLGLNEHSRTIGGNIGYAIATSYRGKGYATTFLAMLLDKADELGVSEKLLTVEKYNPASRKVIEKNGGILIKENEERWFFTF